MLGEHNQLTLAEVLQQLVYQCTHWPFESSVTVQKASLGARKPTHYTYTNAVHQDQNITNMEATQLN